VTKQAPTQGNLVVGVDVGGTKVAAGLVDGCGRIVGYTRTPMVTNGTAAAGLAAVVSAVDSLLASEPPTKHRIRGIGICAPGPLDPKAGVIINPPNVLCWRDFPLADEISQVYGVPVEVDNDANAAALAEARWGAGKGYRNVFYTCIGTGIGTGIVLDGRIYHGRTGAAGEGGHMSIDRHGPRCRCGKPGCIEILASGPAIANRAGAALAEETARGSSLLALANGNADEITGELVAQAFAAGDPVAKKVLLETTESLTLWLGNIIDLLEPDVIIIGGGVAAMLNPFFGDIRRRLPQCCINSRCQEIPVVKAHYGTDAGVAGGAALCWDPPSGYDREPAKQPI
jgi:glucokinase